MSTWKATILGGLTAVGLAVSMAACGTHTGTPVASGAPPAAAAPAATTPPSTDSPPSTDPTTTAPATTTPPTTEPPPPPTTAPTPTYSGKLYDDATQVIAALTPVSVDISANPPDLNAVASDAQSAHDTLNGLKDNFALDAPFNANGGEISDAVNLLKNSMAALGTYTGNPNPDTLANFTSQWKKGVSEWDDAATNLWPGDSSVQI